jgi:large subunit ribosomal protein L24
MNLKKGDTIIVIAGKDKGRQGKIEKVFHKENSVLVPELNQYKKHRKAQGENRPGEILTLSRPYGAAKVALLCPKCKLQTRIGIKILDNKKVRICRKCGAEIS